MNNDDLIERLKNQDIKALYDFGANYVAYVTHRRILIYEVNGIYKIKKTYLFNFNEIVKFKYKIKKGYVKFDFKFADNTKKICGRFISFIQVILKTELLLNLLTKKVKKLQNL